MSVLCGSIQTQQSAQIGIQFIRVKAVYTVRCRPYLIIWVSVLLGYPEWHPYVAKEYEACRERVGIIDMSSFSKFDIMVAVLTTKQPTVTSLLLSGSGHSWISSKNLLGQRGSTTRLNNLHRNAEWTWRLHDRLHAKQNKQRPVRLSDSSQKECNFSYFLVAPSVQQVRCLLWLRRWINELRMNVHVNDVTGLYTVCLSCFECI